MEWVAFMDNHRTKKTKQELIQQQLHFFSMPTSRHLGVKGNTILDYDLVPRFIHDKNAKSVRLSEEPEPKVIHLGESECYAVFPAIIKKRVGPNKGRTCAIYPGTRESLIEDCLILFAQNGEFSIEKGQPGYRLDGGAMGVCFTLSQLRTALRERNKEYRLDELREGLEVLHSAYYTFGDGEKGDLDSHMSYIVSEMKSLHSGLHDDRDDRIVYVAFNPRATEGVKKGKYRSFDSICALSMKSPVARYLFKEFTHTWQNANNKGEPGSVRAIDQNGTILAAGCLLSKNVTKRKNLIIKALHELASFDVIQSINEKEDVVLIKNGKRIVDLQVMVRPSNRFIGQQINGFKRLQHSLKIGESLTKIEGQYRIGQSRY